MKLSGDNIWVVRSAAAETFSRMMEFVSEDIRLSLVDPFIKLIDDVYLTPNFYAHL